MSACGYLAGCLPSAPLVPPPLWCTCSEPREAGQGGSWEWALRSLEASDFWLGLASRSWEERERAEGFVSSPGFPSAKEPACQCRRCKRHRFDPWIRKIPLEEGMASLVAQRVKNLPPMQETWVWSPGQEDPLEEEMATHSSILAWEIPWTEEPGGLQSMELQRVGRDWTMTNTFTFFAWLGFPQGLVALPTAPAPAGGASLPSQHSPGSLPVPGISTHL